MPSLSSTSAACLAQTPFWLPHWQCQCHCQCQHPHCPHPLLHRNRESRALPPRACAPPLAAWPRAVDGLPSSHASRHGQSRLYGVRFVDLEQRSHLLAICQKGLNAAAPRMGKTHRIQTSEDVIKLEECCCARGPIDVECFGEPAGEPVGYRKSFGDPF